MYQVLKKFIVVFCIAVLLVLPGISVMANTPEQDPAVPSAPNPVLQESSEASELDEPVVLMCTEVPLYCNGVFIGNGYMLNSITFVPMLNFFQFMLQSICNVQWDQETETATITANNFIASITLGQGYMSVNGRYLYFPDGVYNINGTILAPIRELAKVFGLKLVWDEDEFALHLDGETPSVFESGDTFYREDDLYWMSRVIFSEAGNQPLEGMIGVGNVVLNRLNYPGGIYGSTLKKVIFMQGQFDVVKTGAIYLEPNELSIVAAKLCLEGYNTVGECRWFVNPNVGATSWFKKYATYYTTIADHDFYA